MKIGNVQIGQAHPVCIVAEMSANHNGDIVKAKELIDAARWAGASLVKMQIYTADEMCLPGAKCPGPGPWEGQDLYELYKRAGTPWEWWPILRDYATSKGVTLFSSAFSAEAVQYLVREGCPAIKLASHEANWCMTDGYSGTLIEPLKARPVVIASACTRSEVASMNWADVVLWCPQGYPATSLAAADLGWLQGMMDYRDDPPRAWGFSDNAGDPASAVIAAREGAAMIEVHLTLDTVGVDAPFSLLPAGFAGYVRIVRGEPRRPPAKPSPYRRSVWLSNPVKRGDSVMEHVKMLRPFGGIEPSAWPLGDGWRAARDLEPGPLRWEDVE